MKYNQVSILLSTYNGEKYLREQINSILRQDFKNWILYIRDDGSQDSTLEIIREYCQKYDFIIFLDSQDKKGAALSFMDLLSRVNSDYYLFCDQDDIWLENKISSLFNVFLQNSNLAKDPMLVFSDAKVVDEKLNTINESFWSYNKTPPSLILKKNDYISIFNCAPGCTMMFNHDLKKKLVDYDENILMHDWYVMIKALQHGTVKYVDTALLLYRQHDSNVLGASQISLKDRFFKILTFKKSILSQLEVLQFVSKYRGIKIFEFYKLKIKFNVIRFMQKF